MKRGPSRPVDRILPIIGRVKFQTGTRALAVKRRWDEMLDSLVDQGRFDLLRDMGNKDRRHLIFSHWQRNALDKLPSGKASDALLTSMEAFRLVHVCGEDRRKQMKYDIRHIAKHARKGATVADLPDTLERLRDTDWARKHKRAFNQVRSTALVFARKTLKKSSWVYIEANAVEQFPRKTTRKAKPLSVEKMRTLFPNPQTDKVDAIAWTMATTGMGQKELWGKWSVLRDRVHINGTKRGGRDRDIPLVRVPTRPKIHRRTFENVVRKRTRDHTAYDLRATFAHWMEQARVMRSRRIMYMGHGKADTTDIYEAHEVDEFLVADAEVIKAYIEQGR